MKFGEPLALRQPDESRPARGAWVEIHFNRHPDAGYDVAPRKGRVG